MSGCRWRFYLFINLEQQGKLSGWSPVRFLWQRRSERVWTCLEYSELNWRMGLMWYTRLHELWSVKLFLRSQVMTQCRQKSRLTKSRLLGNGRQRVSASHSQISEEANLVPCWRSSWWSWCFSTRQFLQKLYDYMYTEWTLVFWICIYFCEFLSCCLSIDIGSIFMWIFTVIDIFSCLIAGFARLNSWE